MTRPLSLLVACLSLASVLGGAPVRQAGGWAFENDVLRVTLDESTAAWDVLDKRSGRLWRQAVEPLQEQWLVPVPRLAAAPVLDGKLDEWTGGSLFLDHKLAGPKAVLDGDADCSARIHLGWTDEGWWLAADVTDDKLVGPDPGDKLWTVDSIELWLGQEHWGFAPGDAGVEIACFSSAPRAEGCRAAAQATATGWRLEAFVPRAQITALPDGPRAGAELLLAVGVNDTDVKPGRQAQLFYPAGYQHRVFSTHALARLAATGQAEAPSTRTHRPGNVTVRQVAALPAPENGVQVELDYANAGVALPLTVRVWLPAGEADVLFELSGNPAVAFRELALPAPFVLDEPEARLVIPQNAGLLFGVDELEWDNKNLGGFMSMPWFGAADLASGQGYVCIFDTPDDVFYRGQKARGTARDVLTARTCFQPRKGQLAYPRRLLFHFADRGGYVALAKRYRAYAQAKGMVKTLAEKRRERPNIDRLVGAVNIYSTSMRNVEIMRDLGIDRLMVSGFSRTDVAQINDLGYLSSRYDIYTDLYEPGRPGARMERCAGFSFPEDVIKKADGSNQVGWCPLVDPKTGEKYPSYVICWQRGLDVLREKMPKRLAESPYNAYFLDCVTATGLYECHDPAHPLDRTMDRETRIEQLRYLTAELGLVAGSEQGRDWAVPVADYFEGVMSTSAFFANPKAIHDMPFATLAPSPDFARYEEYGINPRRRVPLFQLVYGDCCETTWRWGDNSHRMPHLWAQKDLLAIVHAAMPTWVIWSEQQGLFLANPERFKECYENVCRWRRAVGYHEMIDHERLDKDALVQRSRFANGAAVTVNFADEERRVDGVVLPPHSYLITGDAPELAGLPVGRPVRVGDSWEPKDLVMTGNTGFEQHPVFWNPTGGMRLDLQRDIVYAGTAAACLAGTQPDGWSYAGAPKVPLEAGRKYRVRGWLRVDSIEPAHAPKLKCEVHKDGRYLVNFYTPAYDLARLGTWQCLETVFTVPEGADSGRLALEKGTTNPVAATLYLDDVELAPLPAE